MLSEFSSVFFFFFVFFQENAERSPLDELEEGHDVDLSDDEKFASPAHPTSQVEPSASEPPQKLPTSPQPVKKKHLDTEVN